MYWLIKFGGDLYTVLIHLGCAASNSFTCKITFHPPSAPTVTVQSSTDDASFLTTPQDASPVPLSVSLLRGEGIGRNSALRETRDGSAASASAQEDRRRRFLTRWNDGERHLRRRGLAPGRGHNLREAKTRFISGIET